VQLKKKIICDFNSSSSSLSQLPFSVKGRDRLRSWVTLINKEDIQGAKAA
jgi:hypothetical protein